MSLEEKSQENAVESQITWEKELARKKFSALFEIVHRRYENLPNEEVKRDFLAHVEDVLEGVIEISYLQNFSSRERIAVEIAAILHDIAKADKPPKEAADVPNYVLANHHQMAADEIPAILTDDYLKNIGVEENDSEWIRQEVGKAILEHMGPHPGFMSEVLKKVNEELKKKGLSKIVHPSAQGKISRALLAADMCSLAEPDGIRKVLAIRSSGENFLREDKKRLEDYGASGVYLSLGEVRFLSATRSALEAVKMVEELKDWELIKWIEPVLEKSKKETFQDPVSGEELRWEEIVEKIRKY